MHNEEFNNKVVLVNKRIQKCRNEVAQVVRVQELTNQSLSEIHKRIDDLKQQNHDLDQCVKYVEKNKLDAKIYHTKFMSITGIVDQI